MNRKVFVRWSINARVARFRKDRSNIIFAQSSLRQFATKKKDEPKNWRKFFFIHSWTFFFFFFFEYQKVVFVYFFPHKNDSIINLLCMRFPFSELAFILIKVLFSLTSTYRTTHSRKEKRLNRTKKNYHKLLPNQKKNRILKA